MMDNASVGGYVGICVVDILSDETACNEIDHRFSYLFFYLF